LYSYDMGRATDENMLDLLCTELSVTKKSVKEAQARVHKILENIEDIDDLIAKTSHSYEFERIQSVERNILRMSIFELLFDDTIPEKVAIVEAMRLARKFSTKASSSFVNAILDALYKSSQGQTVDENQLQASAEELELIERISKEASLQKQSESSSQKEDDEDDKEEDL
ncbi:MAG TPA: transcription antitermination factor NusB, partial [Parachlamydiaceae bacterium]|nr:transcription antitermination factor NusB [Parachlamydiaceae bacterium]